LVQTTWKGEAAPDDSARDSYLEQLRMKIVSGQIGPDELLTVPTLAKAWGMSTTPVREILLELANDGLIEARRNRGFQVKRPTVTDLKELFALRAQLECYALSCIISVSEQDVAGLMEKARAIEQAVDDKDTLRYLETDRAYHRHLVSLAGNQRLVKMVMNLRDNMRLYGIESKAGLRRQKLSVPQHYQLVELLAASKQDEAIALMRGHVLDWEPIFVEAIAAFG
jgi:DNA-binding GntR family transcriptional regulator